MSSTLRHALSTLFGVGLLVAFVVMFSVAIDRTWGAPSTPGFSNEFLYWGTALAAFVGGVIATAFGVELPRARAAGPRLGARARALLRGMGNFVLPIVPSSKLRSFLIVVYVLLYIGVVAAAGITWAKHSSVMPDVLKSLVTIAAGLAFAITTAFVRG